jgi:hypothetical protein
MQVPGGNSRFAPSAGTASAAAWSAAGSSIFPVTLRPEGFNRQAARERELGNIQLEPEHRRD